jgi:hypothetical protein
VLITHENFQDFFSMRLGVTTDFRVHLRGRNAADIASAPLTPATWTHVAAVANAGQVTLFVNGQDEGTGNATDSFLLSDAEFLIGEVINGIGERFTTGAIDDVRIFTIALDPTDIAALRDEPARTTTN